MLRTRTPDPLQLAHPPLAVSALVALLVGSIALGPTTVAHAQLIKSARMATGNRTPDPTIPAVPATEAKSSRQSFITASANIRITRATAASDPVPIVDPVPIADVPVMSAPVMDAAPVEESSLVQLAPSELGVLDGRTVACQAARCWPLAKFLEERAATVRAEAARAHDTGQRSAELQSNFLRRQAARQRDIAAATALRTYYSWIANREQLASVMAGYELEREQTATQSALIERGIAIDDPTELERKRLELRDNQVQLESNDVQLAQSMLRLTCCASDPRTAVVEALEVQPRDLPCDQLVSFALQHRQDYLAYIELYQCLDEQSARTIADLLSPLAGGIGLGMIDLNCLQKLCLAAHGGEALSHVTRELRSAIELERRLVQQTVCDKCHALRLAYERTAIAEQLLATWDERIAALGRLEQLGDARGQALSTARAQQLQARSTLISRRLAAKLAEIDLAEAMGDLAPRCCRGEPWLITCN